MKATEAPCGASQTGTLAVRQLGQVIDALEDLTDALDDADATCTEAAADAVSRSRLRAAELLRVYRGVIGRGERGLA